MYGCVDGNTSCMYCLMKIYRCINIKIYKYMDI